jgi:hypothetical protein
VDLEQFVPLLMALQLDPVRLLIADDAGDAGVDKTIEALLVARKLWDRGDSDASACSARPTQRDGRVDR